MASLNQFVPPRLSGANLTLVSIAAITLIAVSAATVVAVPSVLLIGLLALSQG